MKRIFFISTAILFLLAFHPFTRETRAACSWTYNAAGGVTASTCGVDGQASEYYDYSSATDDATNGYIVTIPNGVTVTVNAGSSGTFTKLGVGSFNLTGGGTLAVSANYIQVTTGAKCYVYDGDSDGYSVNPTTCNTTGGAGYIRKNKLSSTTADCGDGNSTAKPGQTTAYTTTFTNTATGLNYDWNCDGTETKTYASATYSCGGCTNGSGYASTINSTSGFSGSTPACGAAGTYYTVTNATCRDPAVASCTGSYSTSSVTQSCK